MLPSRSRVVRSKEPSIVPRQQIEVMSSFGPAQPVILSWREERAASSRNFYRRLVGRPRDGSPGRLLLVFRRTRGPAILLRFSFFCPGELRLPSATHLLQIVAACVESTRRLQQLVS